MHPSHDRAQEYLQQVDRISAELRQNLYERGSHGARYLTAFDLLVASGTAYSPETNATYSPPGKVVDGKTLGAPGPGNVMIVEPQRDLFFHMHIRNMQLLDHGRRGPGDMTFTAPEGTYRTYLEIIQSAATHLSQDEQGLGEKAGKLHGSFLAYSAATKQPWMLSTRSPVFFARANDATLTLQSRIHSVTKSCQIEPGSLVVIPGVGYNSLESFSTFAALSDRPRLLVNDKSRFVGAAIEEFCRLRRISGVDVGPAQGMGELTLGEKAVSLALLSAVGSAGKEELSRLIAAVAPRLVQNGRVVFLNPKSPTLASDASANDRKEILQRNGLTCVSTEEHPFELPHTMDAKARTPWLRTFEEIQEEIKRLRSAEKRQSLSVFSEWRKP